MDKKIDFKKMKPQITDEEIRAMMNFDAVHQQHLAALKVKRIKTASVVSAVTLLAVILVSLWKPSGNETTQAQTTKSALPPAQLAPDRTVSAEQPEAPGTTSKEQIVEKKEIASNPVQKTEKPVTPVVAYAEAEPVQGYPNLYAYFRKELRYPQEALADSVEGVVTVSFVINASGQPEQITIQESLGEAFDKEAIRLVSSMPEWKPAMLNGKPVASKISVPLTFQLIIQ